MVAFLADLAMYTFAAIGFVSLVSSIALMVIASTTMRHTRRSTKKGPVALERPSPLTERNRQ